MIVDYTERHHYGKQDSKGMCCTIWVNGMVIGAPEQFDELIHRMERAKADFIERSKTTPAYAESQVIPR